MNVAWLAAISRRTLLAIAGGVVALAALGTAGWFWYANEQHRALATYAEAFARLRAAQSPQAAPEARSAENSTMSSSERRPSGSWV